MIQAAFSNPHRLALLVGDLAMLFAFSILGRMFHSMGTAVDAMMGTAIPFVLGWLIAAPISRAYSRQATESVGAAGRIALLTWLIGYPLGLVIRALILGRGSHWTFSLVGGAFTLLVLVGWRLLYARFRA